MRHHGDGKMVPMLAVAFEGKESERATFLSAPGHAYELKLDGVRLLADAKQLSFRSGRDASSLFPEVLAALQTLPGAPLLDGEIVAFDEDGKPNFERVASRLHNSNARRGPSIVYMVFDILRIEGHSVEMLPFSERRALLEACLRECPAPLRLQTTLRDGAALLQFCIDNALEGIMRKRMDSAYHRGPKRTSHWTKLKLTTDEDLVVFAIVKGDTRAVGAFDLASIRDGKLFYQGRAGSGLDEAALEMGATWARTRACAPFEVLGPDPESPRERTFIVPEQLVRVRFLGRSSRGILRHAVFRGLRDDITLAEAFPDDTL
jgi:bifunctional non-homologous end joining protein LigD